MFPQVPSKFAASVSDHFVANHEFGETAAIRLCEIFDWRLAYLFVFEMNWKSKFQILSDRGGPMRPSPIRFRVVRIPSLLIGLKSSDDKNNAYKMTALFTGRAKEKKITDDRDTQYCGVRAGPLSSLRRKRTSYRRQRRRWGTGTAIGVWPHGYGKYP